MGNPYVRSTINNAQTRLQYAIERAATIETYDQVRGRIKGMLAYDRDLEMMAGKDTEYRYERIREDLKDFVTFLENYITQAEDQAKKEIKP